MDSNAQSRASILGEGGPFPQTAERIRDDPRCSWDTVAGAWILEDHESGKCFEWSEDSKSWRVQEETDERSVAAQDEVFDEFIESLGMKKSTGAGDSKASKRKAEEEVEQQMQKSKQAKVKAPEPSKPLQNKAIYVTNIPLDATFEEIHDKFRRFGLIAESIDTEKPRIKMYANDDGSFKGEALITYFRWESVSQAIMLADGGDLRHGGSGTLRVQAADMDYKKNKEYQHIAEPDKKQKKDLEKVKQMNEKMNAKLADWDDDEPVPEKKVNQGAVHSDTIIIKNMFTLYGLEVEREERIAADVAGVLYEDSVVDAIPEDIRDMAKAFNWGLILSVDVYDAEPEGVVRVKFSSDEAATAACKWFNANRYDERQTRAEILTGRRRYRKVVETEEDQARRMRNYGRYLNAQAGKK